MRYTYYNTRYNAKPSVFTTKYYSYYNNYISTFNTKNIVYVYNYSYSTSYCKGPAIVQDCNVKEATDRACNKDGVGKGECLGARICK